MATQDYDKMFANKENCFGKMYDMAEAECKKCGDSKSCQEYMTKSTKKAAPVKHIAEEKPVKKEKAKKKVEEVEEEEVEEVEEKVTPKKKVDKPSKKAKKVEEVEEEEVEEEEEKPAKKKAAPAKDNKKSTTKDENGFNVGSISSIIFARVKSGKYTKANIYAEIEKIHPGFSKKSTLGVFLADVQKPVGKYTCSRGVAIVTDKQDRLSFKK